MLLKKFIKILDGHLTNEDKKLIRHVHNEMKMNNHVKEIYNIINPKNLYIPFLPDLDGDCLFHSLSPHLGDIHVQDLRNILATVMRVYKSDTHFLPCDERPLQELFEAVNEIEYVSCTDKNGQVRFYKYTYDIMCRDLSNLSSWDRLPMQLILLVLSYIYKVEIEVINNSDTIHDICAFNPHDPENRPTLRKITVGHINEFHYIPTFPKEDNKEYQCPCYNKYHTKMEKKYQMIKDKYLIHD